MRASPLFRPGAVLEKKKLAASHPFFLQSSLIVCAKADLPAPAGPYILTMEGAGLLSSIQSMIFFVTASRVSGWHLAGSMRSLESNTAAIALYWRRRAVPMVKSFLTIQKSEGMQKCTISWCSKLWGPRNGRTGSIDDELSPMNFEIMRVGKHFRGGHCPIW